MSSLFIIETINKILKERGNQIMKAKIKDVKYKTYLTGETHLHVHNGNRKTGKGIYLVNLLPGSKLLSKKDGTVLTNIVGSCVGCCENCCESDCYAIRYTIRHHNTCVRSYAENTVLARHDIGTFFNELQLFIDRSVVAAIRFHAAGEIPSFEYLVHMAKIAKNNPTVTFYTYTKRYAWLEKYVKERGDLPSNLVISVSIWKNNYDNPLNFPEFIYDDGTDESLKNIIHCPAVDKKGHDTGETCSHCKMCFRAKKGDKIAVYAH